MGLFYTEDHLGDVEASDGFGEAMLAYQQAKEIAAGHVVHHQIQVLLILETGE